MARTRSEGDANRLAEAGKHSTGCGTTAPRKKYPVTQAAFVQREPPRIYSSSSSAALPE